MNKSTKRMLKYLAIAFIVLMFLRSECAKNIMRYSPIEIGPKTKKSVRDVDYSMDCLSGSGKECESSHSRGLDALGTGGLHAIVRDQHDYGILSGIGME